MKSVYILLDKKTRLDMNKEKKKERHKQCGCKYNTPPVYEETSQAEHYSTTIIECAADNGGRVCSA